MSYLQWLLRSRDEAVLRFGPKWGGQHVFATWIAQQRALEESTVPCAHVFIEQPAKEMTYGTRTDTRCKYCDRCQGYTFVPHDGSEGSVVLLD